MRSLGFVAIEGRGIDGSPALIGRARAAGARCEDPAIGLVFDVADMADALREEQDVPADIILCHLLGRQGVAAGVEAALHAAGDMVIGDAAPMRSAAA